MLRGPATHHLQAGRRHPAPPCGPASGTPGVAAYFLYIAEEARAYLAQLGLRTMDEAVGRVELLRQRTTGDERAGRARPHAADAPPEHLDEPRHFVERVRAPGPRSRLGDEVTPRRRRARRVWDGDEIDLHCSIRNRTGPSAPPCSGPSPSSTAPLPPLGTAASASRVPRPRASVPPSPTASELELVGRGQRLRRQRHGRRHHRRAPPANDALVVMGSAAIRPCWPATPCLCGATGG